MITEDAPFATRTVQPILTLILIAPIGVNHQVDDLISELNKVNMLISEADCLLYAMWSGNHVNGELAVTTFNASTLREVGIVQSTTFKKVKFRECFVARQIIYCIGMFNFIYDQLVILKLPAPAVNDTMQLIYDIKNQKTIPVNIQLPSAMRNVVSLQFSK